MKNLMYNDSDISLNSKNVFFREERTEGKVYEGNSFFVKKPSRLSNLLKPHRIEDEVPYETVRTIFLPQIDYENLATDLTVDREYIEQYTHLCGIQDGVWRCLLIQQENAKTGILVMLEDQAWVGYAAYYGFSVPKIPR